MLRFKQMWFCVLVMVFAFAGCTPTPTPAAPTEQAGLPNPASVYCEEKGGKLEIRTDESGGQVGFCVFPDGSECEEWAYFRGECQPGTAVVEPTNEPIAEPTAVVTPRYINDTYGFSFSPADEWEIETHEDYVLFTQPGYKLFAGFQYANEDPHPFRTGMPSGEFVDGGSAALLGQPLPKRILVDREKNKVVSYGGRIKIGDLILVLYFDAVPTDAVAQADLNISAEMIAQADQLIATFALTSGKQPQLEFNP